MISKYERYKIENVLPLFPHIQITKNIYLIRSHSYEKRKFCIWRLIKAIDK